MMILFFCHQITVKPLKRTRNKRRIGEYMKAKIETDIESYVIEDILQKAKKN